MKQLFTTLTGLAFILSFLSVQAADQLKAFPSAGVDSQRFILQLPEQENEADYQVELIVGKTVKTDARNHYFFAGKIEERNIEGWGYSRYIVDKIGAMAGTLMAVDPQEPKIEHFVALGGNPYLIRYNSKLPVVVYVPKGVEVRYRIWSVLIAESALEIN